MAAAKNEHADKVAELIDTCHNAPTPAPGHPTVVQLLEEAFVHALAGDKAAAEACLQGAVTEIAKFPALAEREFALLEARVHAVLANLKPKA